MKTTILSLLFLFSLSVMAQDVTINTQVWQSKNLNVGVMIPLSQPMTNNGIVEKYCYKNLEANCTLYGGLYSWGEMMQYQTAQGSQGICGEGYHVPTNDEWHTLIFSIGDSLTSGRILKQSGWVNWLWPRAFDWKGYTPQQREAFGNAIVGLDTYGFGFVGTGKALPGVFMQRMEIGYAWTSTQDTYYHAIAMFSNGNTAHNYSFYKSAYSTPKGLAVRCIKN